MIWRAWRFFTHPVAIAGAIFGLALMTMQLGGSIFNAAYLFTAEPPVGEGVSLEPGTAQFSIAIGLSVTSIFMSLLPGLLLVFGAIVVEYAARISRDVRHIRSMATPKRSQGE